MLTTTRTQEQYETHDRTISTQHIARCTSGGSPVNRSNITSWHRTNRTLSLFFDTVSRARVAAKRMNAKHRPRRIRYLSSYSLARIARECISCSIASASVEELVRRQRYSVQPRCIVRGRTGYGELTTASSDRRRARPRDPVRTVTGDRVRTVRENALAQMTSGRDLVRADRNGGAAFSTISDGRRRSTRRVVVI